jgi:glycosyltransferase involved in cell wall biosynthesis
LPEVGGEAAVYFDPYSIDDMVAKISFVLDQPLTERKKMIEAGVLQAKKFSWDSCADEMWEEFRNILSA